MKNCNLLKRILKMVELYPENIAVRYEDGYLSYAELWEKAQKLSNTIKDICSEEIVGISAKRDINFVVGILAIWMVDGAYLPLDFSLPQKRVEYILHKANINKVIMSENESFNFNGIEGIIYEKKATEERLYSTTDNLKSALAYVMPTSGSTGFPKLVAIEHKSVTSFLDAFTKISPVKNNIIGTSICPFYFDVSIFEIFRPLVIGGTVIILDEEVAKAPTLFRDALIKYKITSSYLPPFILNDLADLLVEVKNQVFLESILVGVESIPQVTLQKWRDLFSDLNIINGYGPTETTICATFFPFKTITESQKITPIGRAVEGLQVEIVNDDLECVKDGEVGEIVIAGQGLLRKYIGSDGDDKTIIKLDNIECKNNINNRWYKTGDLAYRNRDGEIVFSGRKDTQVKIRGVRIDLREIENVLLANNKVKSVVICTPEYQTGKRMYVFVESDETTETIQGYLERFIPKYMFPTRIESMKCFPITSNGKVDREKLLEQSRRRVLKTPLVEASSEIEKAFVKIWCDCLGLDTIGIKDDFYELGGDSRLALLASYKMAEYVENNLKASKFLTCKTIFEAVKIAGNSSVFRNNSCVDSTYISSEMICLSEGQKGIWAYQKMNMDDTSFVIPIAIKFSGINDYTSLFRKINHILKRHDLLSMSVDLYNNTLVWKKNDRMLLNEYCKMISENNLGDNICKLFWSEIKELTYLENGIAKGYIARTDKNNFVFVLLVHHIGIDGESANILYEEIYKEFLNETPLSQTTDLCSIEKYINQYNTYMNSDYFLEDKLFWKQILSENLAPIDKLFSNKNTKNATRAECNFYFSKKNVECLNLLKNIANVTEFEVLFSIINILIYTLCNREDYVISIPTSLRHMDRNLQDAVGYFVNLIPIKANINKDIIISDYIVNTAEFLRRCRVHAKYPFEKMKEDFFTGEFSNGKVLTSFVIAEDVNYYEKFDCDNCNISVLQVPKYNSIYDLTLFAKLKVNNPSLKWEFNLNKYSIEDIEKIDSYFDAILNILLKSPNSKVGEIISNLRGAEDNKENCCVQAMQGIECMREENLISIFKDIVNEFPDNVALIEETGLQYTYKELDFLSDEVAKKINNSGSNLNEAILLISERSADFIIKIIGVLKANCAYIPVDDKVPVFRIRQIVQQANVKRYFITDNYSNVMKKDVKAALCNLICIDDMYGNSSLDALVVNKRELNTPTYVMFTSGSTGNPKGVIIPDRGVIRLAKYPNFVKLNSSDVFILMSNISFDATTFEIWGALLNGAALFIPEVNTMKSPKMLLNKIHGEHVSVGFFNVTMFRWILEEDIKALEHMHSIIVGGEIVPPKLFVEAAKYISYDKLVNGYGPTENTTFTCCYRLQKHPLGLEHIPVGFSLAYSSTLIVDEEMNVVPDGVEGEIIVSGAGVALGYIGDKEETDKSFINLGIGRGVWYKTGDIGVVQKDKSIICLGRKDNQVKIRGFRIEIDEVEKTISSFDKIRDVVVLSIDAIEGKRLEAYVVGSLCENEVRELLKEKLPDYMIPSNVYIIDNMPINEHGKKDRHALRKIGEKMKNTERSTNFDDVGNQISIKGVNKIFSGYLGVEEIDPKIRFFDLGFNSLLIAMVSTTISKEYKVDVSSLDIIEHPTLLEFYDWLCKKCDSDYLGRQEQLINMDGGNSTNDIAIVGMSGRFPGCDDIDTFWEHSIEGKVDVSSFETSLKNEIGNRGIISDTDKFDAEFFGVTYGDAKLMDPQQRVLLEVCQSAFDDAAIDISFVTEPISVYATSASNEEKNGSDSLSEQYEKMLVTSSDLVAMQISYRLNLTGESITVQTGCSSSLVAVNMACQSLLANKSYISLAAGVSFPLEQQKGYFYEEGMITSKTGKCCPFDMCADGTVPGSGAAAVVLMRKEDAIAIKAPIYGIIKAICSNNDGSSKVGFMAPSSKGQEEVIKAAHKLANVKPIDIEYVETHGTATKLGDAIEVKALSQVFKKNESNCALGSAKANIGHLDRASGITGLIRAVKAVNSGIIPPMANFTQENPELNLSETGLYVPQKSREWKNKKRRIAGVSSFGVGGTNVHAVVESYDAPCEMNMDKGEYFIVPLSSHKSNTLKNQKTCLSNYLQDADFISIKNVSATLIKGRTAKKYRTFFTANSKEDLLNEVRCNHEIVDADKKRNTVWVFQGNGDQGVDVYAEMYSYSDVYRNALDQCVSIIESIIDIDVKRILFSGSEEAEEKLKDLNVYQPVMFAVQWAHVSLWMSLGYKPDVVLGHSLGEIMAATVAGVFSLEDAIKLTIWRSKFMHANPVEGAVLTVNMSSRDIRGILPDNTFIAADNGKDLVAVSGERGSIASLKEELERRCIKSRYLSINRIVHSPQMKTAAAKLIKKLESIEIQEAKIPVISNVYGRITDKISTIQYWGDHICNTVRFRESLELLSKEYSDSIVFIIGSGKSLTAMISNEIEDNMSFIFNVEDKDPEKAILNTIGVFWKYGIENDLNKTLLKFYKTTQLYNQNYSLMNLPATVFDHSCKWLCKSDKISNSVENNIIHQGLVREKDCGAWLWKYDMDKIEIQNNGITSKNFTIIYDIPDEGSDEFEKIKEESEKDIIWIVDSQDMSLYNKAYILRKNLMKKSVWICPINNSSNNFAINNNHIFKAVIKCISLEIPDTSWHVVLGIKSLENSNIETLLEIINKKDLPEVLYIKAGEIYAENFIHSWPSFTTKPVKDNGLYVITGGGGRVARALIKAIGNLVSANIILLGRSILDNKVFDTIKTKNKLNIKYLSLDITNQSSVNELFNKLREEYGRIDGVIHAAGQTNTNSFQTLGRITEDRVNEISEAKVQGCNNIDSALLDSDADFVMLCSSLSNALGGVAFSSYIAANLYLDDFAYKKFSQGDRRWISVAWDAWTDDTPSLNDNNAIELSRFALDDEDGINIFPYILASDNPVVFVSTGNVIERRNHVIQTLSQQIIDDSESDEDFIDFKEVVLNILENVIGEIPKDYDQDLRERGLESLTILQIVSKVRKATRHNILLSDVMNELTVNGLLNLLNTNSEEQDNITSNMFTITKTKTQKTYPISSLQRRWLLLMPEMYGGLDLVVKITGSFEDNQLYKAVERVVLAHSGLRTRFPIIDGEWVQVIEDKTNIEEIDLSKESEVSQRELLRNIVDEKTKSWFDVENKVPFEIVLAKLSSNTCAMIIHAHHVLFDGTSSSIFFRDIARAMDNKVINPEFQYVDYAVKQHEYMNGDDIIPYRKFWTKHFKGAKFPLVIPGDIQDQNVDDNGDFVKFKIDEELLANMRDNARKRGVTIFNIMFAAFGLLLQYKTKENDLVIGTTVAGRPIVETENIVGVFVNPLPLRIIIDENKSLNDYIEQIKTLLINFHENSHYPMEDLTKHVPPFIGVGLNDTFQAYILYQNYWRPEKKNLDFDKFEVGATTHHKLMREYELVLEQHENELIGEFWYKTCKYKAETIKKDADKFISFIKRIISEKLPDTE